MKFETVFEYIPKFETKHLKIRVIARYIFFVEKNWKSGKSNGKVKERTWDPFCAIGKLQVLGGRKRRRKIGDLEQRLIGIYDWCGRKGRRRSDARGMFASQMSTRLYVSPVENSTNEKKIKVMQLPSACLVIVEFPSR